MNLIRIFLVLFIISCLNFSAMADNHSKKEEVVDKAKEITKKTYGCYLYLSELFRN